jgi:hypothetical protein
LIILITRIEEYKIWSSSLCSFLQPPLTSSLFGPNDFHISWNGILMLLIRVCFRFSSFIILIKLIIKGNRSIIACHT